MSVGVIVRVGVSVGVWVGVVVAVAVGVGVGVSVGVAVEVAVAVGVGVGVRYVTTSFGAADGAPSYDFAARLPLPLIMTTIELPDAQFGRLIIS